MAETTCKPGRSTVRRKQGFTAEDALLILFGDKELDEF